MCVLYSCTTTEKVVHEIANEDNCRVLYAVNNDGIYLYSYSNNETKKICDMAKEFLPRSLHYVNDSLILIGENVNSEEEPTLMFYNINIKFGSYKKYKKVDIKKNQDETASLTTIFYSKTGNIINQKDTVLICNNLNSKYRGFRYCNVDKYINQPKLITTREVFSKRGSIYIIENGIEKNILEHTGNYSRRISSGYFGPTLSSDGEKVAYRYIAGLMNPNSGIYEANIETGNQNLLTDDPGYFNPEYSPNDEFVLLGKNKRQAENKNWIEDFYVLKIKSAYALMIGEGDNYIWIK